MNYLEMSDYQINNLVHNSLLDEPWVLTFLAKEKILWVKKNHQIETEKVEYSRNGLLNYCNSWTDAGPIIEKYRITIEYDGEEKSDNPCAWVNVSSIDNLHAIKYQHTERTLRAAMIVFLMMQESK